MAALALTLTLVGEVCVILGAEVRVVASIAATYLVAGWLLVCLMIYTARQHRAKLRANIQGSK